MRDHRINARIPEQRPADAKAAYDVMAVAKVQAEFKLQLAVAALELITSSDSFNGGSTLKEVQGIARDALKQVRGVRYQAGDGTRFDTLAEARAYADGVAKRTNVILGIEEVRS